MTRTYDNVWKELYDLGAPDISIARACETYAGRIAAWRKKNNLPLNPYRVGRHRGCWEDKHQDEINEILERR